MRMSPIRQDPTRTSWGGGVRELPWRKLLRQTWPWALLVALMLAVNLAGLWLDGAVRNALATETRWAHAIKAATGHLRGYIETGDAQRYQLYAAAMAVPEALRKVHGAATQAEPDFAAAQQHLAAVLTRPQDASSLVLWYRLLGRSSTFAPAMRQWDSAHELMDQFRALEQGARMLHSTGRPNQAAAAAMVLELTRLDQALETAADRFSFEMVNGARSLRNAGQVADAVLAALLLVFGLLVAGRALHRAEQAQRRLQEANERFDLAVDGANDGIWDWDLRARTVVWTPRFREMLGFDSDEGFAGVYQLHRNIHPDDSASLLEARRRYLRGESQRMDLELRLRCKDGSYRWFRMRGRAMLGSDGRAVRVIGTLSDTHERHLAEQAQLAALLELRTASAELELALDAGQVALWSFDPRSGRILQVRRWHALLGDAPIPATFAEWQAAVHPDDRQARMERLQRHLRNETPHYESEFRMRHSDGRWVWLRSRGRVTRVAQDGTALEYAGAVMDVTQQVQAREKQREQYEFLQAMIEGIEAGVMLSSLNRVHYVNQNLCRILGYERKEDLMGKLVRTLAPDAAMADYMMGRRRAVMAGKEVPVGVIELLNAQGEPVKLEASLTHVKWNGVSHFVSTLTPLNEHERLQHRLQTAQVRFERVLLGELETQQAHIARELHDSLGSVLAGLSLMMGAAKATAPGNTALGEALDRCQDQVTEAAETTRALARGLIPVGSHQGALLQALEQFTSDLETVKGVEAELQVDGELDDIPTSAANHIYRVVQEAVSNALRHGNASTIRIAVEEADGGRCVVVEDNGRGFDPEALETAHAGLGLRSMQARAEAIGARLEFSRPRSGGFRVRLRMPRAAHPPAPVESTDTTW